MTETEFNLIDEPWILALDHAGRTKMLGLRECFRQAHQLKALAGELPTQDAAVLRLLLAIVYAVHVDVDADGRQTDDADNDAEAAIARWQKLWSGKCFQPQPIAAYLEHYRDRFWLFHPERPFFQAAGLRTRNGEVNPVSQLICDVPSRATRRFFCNRNGEEADSLSFAEAARWLVDLQAWDYAGKKAAPIGGDPNGGGTGWLGKLGVVYAERDNLFETLVLNLILLTENGRFLPLGSPCWHGEPQPHNKAERYPKGYVELLTWQSRRVSLFRTNGRVTGVLASYGDVFEKENLTMEQMSGWHASSQPGRGDTLIPNLHSASRSAWRDLSSLLPHGGERGGKKGAANRSPGIIQWLRLLEERGLVDLPLLRLRTTGLEYGTMQAIVEELISDSVDFSASLLTEVGKNWLPRIYDLIEKTDAAVKALGDFARDLYEASGGSDKKGRDKAAEAARQDAYFALDLPFRKWLLGVNPADNSMEAKAMEWQDAMRDTVLGQAGELMERAGEKALVGIMKRNGDARETHVCNAITAQQFFRRKLLQIAPRRDSK